MRLRITIAFAAVLIASSAHHADAQAPSQPPPASKPTAMPLQVQVVISRFQGEKKVSSLPYTLSVNADGQERAQLRMGAEVPVPTTTFQPISPTAPDKPAPKPLSSFSYRSIGTEIDCTASPTDDDRFRLILAISDSSVYPDAQDPGTLSGGTAPVLRSFRSTNIVVLRDGQSRQFTAATDRISGEVVRAEVTLTVLK
jgi:hypothetical protein